jgi:hypothetical protein
MLRSLWALERGWATDLLVESHMWFAVGFDAVMRAAALHVEAVCTRVCEQAPKGWNFVGWIDCMLGSSSCLVLVVHTFSVYGGCSIA